MTIEGPSLELGSLVAFENVAAGHEGVLTDPSGDLVIKPCTQAELDFYEETVAQHADFAALIPTFMGTLQLGRSKQLEKTVEMARISQGAPAIVLPTTGDDMQVSEGLPEGADVAATRGKPLDTELAVVLENVAAGFKRPNILDVKLGKRLWADDAPLAKRQKLDKVAAETTSAPLGFRVAGMKVWRPEGYAIYDKWYGRDRTPDTVKEAFQDLFAVSQDDESFDQVIDGVVEAVEEIEDAVRSHETRMYSSSLLLVYEGDRAARKDALDAAYNRCRPNDSATALPLNPDDNDDESDDDDDFEQSQDKKIFDLRLIDFAHAAWTPGQGPDENMLAGITSVRTILHTMALARTKRQK